MKVISLVSSAWKKHQKRSLVQRMIIDIVIVMIIVLSVKIAIIIIRYPAEKRTEESRLEIVRSNFEKVERSIAAHFWQGELEAEKAAELVCMENSDLKSQYDECPRVLLDRSDFTFTYYSDIDGYWVNYCPSEEEDTIIVVVRPLGRTILIVRIIEFSRKGWIIRRSTEFEKCPRCGAQISISSWGSID